jgi:uncharacterized protein (DUF2062 family)
LICSVVFGGLGYLSMNLLWRRSVVKTWQQRRVKRRERHSK